MAKVEIVATVLTISDSAARGEREDKSGPAVVAEIFEIGNRRNPAVHVERQPAEELGVGRQPSRLDALLRPRDVLEHARQEHEHFARRVHNRLHRFKRRRQRLLKDDRQLLARAPKPFAPP